MNKIVFIFVFCMIGISSCGSGNVPQESFDSIVTTTYKNIYDDKDRLSGVSATTTYSMYQNGSCMKTEISGPYISNYKYLNDSEYIIEEHRQDPEQIVITKHLRNAEETLYLNVSKDTIRFSLCQYYDENQDKPKYIRELNKISGYPGMNLMINDDYEETYYYDKEGYVMIIRYDFNTSQKTTTYKFNDSPYDAAIKEIPQIDENTEVICYSEKAVGDTIINQQIVNGVVESVVKTCTRDDEKVELIYDQDMVLLESRCEFEKNGYNITVDNNLWRNSTDSLYYQDKKQIKSVSISDERKIIESWEYDKQGNVIKNIQKIKFLSNNI